MSVSTEDLEATKADAATDGESSADASPSDVSQPTAATPSPWPQRVKYFLVKCASTTGLNFLTPLILLAYGEEPVRQLKEILRVVVAPMLAFGVFIYLWTVVAPLHKTKSGEVPTPAVVWDAAGSIWTFHEREGHKEQAYAANETTRESELATLRERRSKVAAYETAVKSLVEKREVEAAVWFEKATTDINAKIKATKEQQEQAQLARQNEMEQLAKSLSSNDVAGKEKYLESLRSHMELLEIEDDVLSELNDERSALLDAKYPPLQAARTKLNSLAEEKQYLGALEDQLTDANRNIKLDVEISRLKGNQRNLLAAETPEDIAKAAKYVVLSERRIRSISDSTYAKPWTLPMQIIRSVACAFCGFLLGTMIAIPIGVLCGLSPTFMSAMTPFIALFKPVSPIVWLPIALIVVGGFIPDPDEHWLIAWLADAWFIGWMKINPAFMASAITVALCSLWATMVNTALGVSSVDQDHINVARVLRLGFWSRLFKIVIPSSLPLIFAGLRISLGVGWMVLIAGELLSSSEGIGKFVWDQFNNGASDSFAKMIVVVFVVGVIGLLLDRIMIVLQRLVSFDDAAAAL